MLSSTPALRAARCIRASASTVMQSAAAPPRYPKIIHNAGIEAKSTKNYNLR
jgi:hypothetical protein